MTRCRTASLIGWCVVGFAILVSQTGKQVASAPETTAPSIPGVIAGRTTVQLVLSWAPKDGGEAPIAAADGSLLFAKQHASQIMKIDKNGKSSIYLENTNGAVGLAYDPKGRLIGVGQVRNQVEVLAPTRSVLVRAFKGRPFIMPADLVIDRKGGVYFTDHLPNDGTPEAMAQANAYRASGRLSEVYYLKPDGQLVNTTEDVPDPNGIQLSPDEKVLYVANETGQFVIAFDVQPDGRVRNARNFARVSEAGVACHANGLAVDAAGRLYVAAFGGVHIFSPLGQRLGTIPIPVRPANLAFAGPDKKTLYVTAKGVLYKIPMQAEGFKGRAK